MNRNYASNSPQSAKTRNHPVKGEFSRNHPPAASSGAAQRLARPTNIQQQPSQPEPQHVIPPQSKHETGGGPAMTFVNAPTSLANLAQLSGITLFPIGDYNNTDSGSKDRRPSASHYNLPQNVSIQAPSSHRITSTPIKKSNNQSQPTGPAPSRQLNSAKAKQNPTNDQSPRVFNIASIPSVQSLNQTSNDLIFKRGINVVDHSRSRFKNHTQSMSTANAHNEPNERIPMLQKVHSLGLTNGIQVIPVSTSVPAFHHLSTNSQPANYSNDDMIPQSSLGVQDEHFVNVNGDANNISLLKLMAILNNPALTVTAVGSRDQSNNHIDNSSQSDIIFNTSKRQMSSATTDSKHKPNQLPVRQASSSSTIRNLNANTKTRIPQSAANIQILHGTSFGQQLNESVGFGQSAGVSNSHIDTQTVQQSDEQSHNDFKLDWLSKCQQNYQASSNRQVQYPDDLQEIDYSSTTDSSDPTMLSTSVRNLLMQQISQGTNKQQAVSAQLLRHIANQAQDNDESSSSQNQVPIAEPVCIPDQHRRVEQVSRDAKIVETDQTVSTAGLPKKKSRGPTRTSRYRLYVPGMDNGNLRHSRTNESRYYLNDIQIVNNQEREVHLSERHQMIEAMMNLEDKKRRRNEMTEPDEIFINRSKRVMSKIDTMLERKKRRRFERISGRESPKNNSIEEQCAESDDEWSSDEPMDVDSIGIVKTQLPLEEAETQEKKQHLMSVGLVSRDTKHTIEVEFCERKMKLMTPLAFQDLEEPPGDIDHFVETILKSNGEEVQLRVDSNIKRNDLPLVEGLNRNTSRLKMNYMNILGLEKRSKRTTLYKVKQLDNASTNAVKQTDLSKPQKNSTLDEQSPRTDTGSELRFAAQRQALADCNLPSKDVPAPKLILSNCRDVIKVPSKNEYMKCLGLMAS